MPRSPVIEHQQVRHALKVAAVTGQNTARDIALLLNNHQPRTNYPEHEMPKMTGRELKALIRRLSDVKLDVPQIQKQGDFTCWAGCYRMIDAYHGKTIPFSQYLKLKNPECTLTGCNVKPCPACDKPRLITDVLRDLRKLSYKGTASFTTNPTVAEIKTYLTNKTPLMIFKHNGAAVGHFVLVTGVVMKGLFLNQFLIINDPDLHKQKVVDVLDACLRNGTWSQTWVVSK